MAIPMYGGVGDLFNRVGKIGALIKNTRSYQATQLTSMTSTTTGVVAQFNAESDIQAEMGSSYIGLLNGFGNVGNFCQQMAQDTVNRMVFRDQPQLNQTLTQTNLVASLQEVIRQMQQQGATVLAMTVTGTPGTVVGTGNGVMNVSVKRPSDGRTLENALAESVLFTCTSDSYTGSAEAGNEGFSVTGTGSAGYFDFNWPLGSNASVSLSAIDGNSDASAGNDLTNSGFENWTANVPDNWTLVVGTAGTNISEETVLVYAGSAALKITGDAGGTLTELTQEFDNSTDGTPTALDPTVQKSVNLFVRRDGVAAGAGVLQVAWVDENDSVILDEAGTANSFTIDLTALTVNYTSYLSTFRSPSIMPGTVKFRLKLTTALTNGRSVYVDTVSQGDMTQLYTSGPYFAVHSGDVPFQISDYGYTAVTNSRGSGGTLSTFQTLFDTLFGMRQLDLLLPSSSSPAISDSLIA